jgi:hypothetical protein
MLSGALQRNAEHEIRLSNIIALFAFGKLSKILRFAQNDSGEVNIGLRIEVQKWIYPSNNFPR